MPENVINNAHNHIEPEFLSLVSDNTVLCFCNSNKVWGGGETWHAQAALYFAQHFSTLKNKNCKVIVATAANAPLGEYIKNKIDAVPGLATTLFLHNRRFSNLDFLNPLKVGEFASWLKQNKVTHLIMGLPSDLKAGVMAGRRLNTGMRLIYRRGSAIPVKNSLSNKFFYGSLHALITNSHETARGVLEGRNIIATNKVHVIYNSLDIAAFDSKMAAGAKCVSTEPELNAELVNTKLQKTEPAYTEQPLAQLQGTTPAPASSPAKMPNTPAVTEPLAGLQHYYTLPEAFTPERPLIIGNAGRLNVQKGQKYLLSMSAALNRLKVPHRLIIAGSGELQKELEQQAAALGLDAGYGINAQNQLVFAGFMANMTPFWQSIDLFMLSSLWEGFGYVLAEAMLAEKPVGAFNCNSMPELVKPKLNGFLVAPPANGESTDAVGSRMAEAVKEFCSSTARMREYGKNGRGFCTANFAQSVTMQQVAALLFS